jgi:hypothetical protein
MATLNVGPSSTYHSIAEAIAPANPGDTIALDAGYTEAGTVSVTKDSLSFQGDGTNTGIHLALANGVSSITLLGAAPFRVDDNAGADTINMNNGGDTAQVSGGSDTVNGGTGNDRLIVDYHNSTTAVTGGATGNSSPTGYSGSISDSSGNSVNFNAIENLTITTGSGDDNLHLGDATGGNDVVSLGSGDDFVYSGTGIDQIDGGTGNDGWAADMSSQSTGINIDLAAGSSAFLTTGSVTGIEYLGGDGSFLHTFSTGSGNDTIVTKSGNFQDSIFTNDGNDTITVAGGNDNVDGGSGNDRLIVDYHTSTTAVTGGATGNSSPTGYSGSISDGAGNSVNFNGIENFTITTGSGDDNLHLGDASGGDDVVSLGTGDDFVYSGTGIDQIDGGAGNDTWGADMSSQTGAINIDLTAGSSTFLATGSVTGVEALGGDGSSLHFFNTGSGNDTIVTRTDVNLADNISTNGGNDTVTIGGTTGSHVTDHVDGGAGRDRLIVDYSTTTDTMNGDFASSGSLVNGYNGDISIPSVQLLVTETGIEDFTIKTGSGNDTIQTGDGNDVISSGGGDDQINTRKGVDQVDGGAGNDNWLADMSAAVAGENISINLNNASSTFTVGGVNGSVAGIEALGGFGGNTFKTGAGDDTIVTRTDLNLEDDIATGDGNDMVTIGGTTGANVTDHVDGGAGRDRLIVDYSTTTDTMNGDFASSGNVANGYNGDISIPSVHQLVGETSFEDFTVKTGSGNDTIQTGDGNDVISSGGGNDQINTRKGVDQVDGGAGNDNWLADMSAAVAGENISINLNNASSTFTVGGVNGSVTGIEALGGFGGNTFKTGAGDDTIVTRTDLNLEDDIATGDGNDTVTIGGTTSSTVTDHVDGGAGRDRLIVDYSTTTDTMNGDFASSGNVANGYSGDISIPNVQQLVGESGFEDFTVKTGSGNDTIQTGDGNDVISSGSGDDSINTRGGVDQVDGGTGTDRWLANMSAAVAGENISINLNNASSTFTVGGVNGSVTGIEALGGFGGNKFLTGAGDDIIVTRTDLNLEDDISTGDGNDTVTVGGTTGTTVTDTVDGGAGRDRLIVDYHTTTDNIANNLAASGSFAGGYSGDLSRPGITQVVASSGFEDFTVSTGSGDDTVTTGGGDDILNLGTGNDVVHAAGGTDRLIVDYHATSNAVTVNGLTGSVGAGYSGSVTDGTTGFTVTFDGIENFTITGGSGDDSITTGDGDDVLRGGAGVDDLHAAGGNDTFIVAAGDISSGDVFDGAGGTDTLQVTGTVDFTGATLTSIEALTFATSGESTTTFGFNVALDLPSTLAVTGDSNINHIVVNTIGANFSGWTFSNWTNGTDTIAFEGEAGGDVIIGTSQNDKIETFGADDTVTGGAGNDDIDGGSGIDTAVYTGARSEYSGSFVGGALIITDSVNGRDGQDTLHNMEFVQFSDGTFAINTAPTLATIPTAASVERTFAILNSAANVSDAQLDALNSNNGDYSGASLTIQRHLGANADDDFGFGTSANFTVSLNTLQAGGQTFATFTNTGGTLTITFANGGATPTAALVNDVLQHITYANENHNPVSQVTLDWTFSDGEVNDFGGALSAAQSQTVNITGLDDAPVNTVPGAQSLAEDGTLAISGLSISDADSGASDVTTTLSVAHGTITVAAGVSGGLALGQISGSGTATVTLTGTVAQINATLAGASSVHYAGNLDFNGSDTLTVTTNDDMHSGISTANLIVNPGAEAGTVGGTPTGWAATAGIPALEDYATFGGLSTSVSNAVGGGANYFTGGDNQTVSTLRQIVDVSSYATQIDAGEATANLSGYFGGWLDQDDNATLTAHFLDGSSVEIGSLTIGGVTATDRNDVTDLLFREGHLLVPVGTKSIELDLTSTRSIANFDDGYADNLSLTLTLAQKDTDTVAITVTEVNDAPIGNNDSLSSIAEDSGVRTITFAALTGNDAPGPVTATDEAGQTLTVSAVSNATGGTVAIVSGHVEFTPTANFNGTAGFDYTVQDNGTTNDIADPKTATAHVSFSITAVNDAPAATNLTQSLSLAEDVASPPKLFTAAPVVSDVDSASVTVTLTLANTAAGTLSTGTSAAVTSAYDSGTGVWTASGAKADINTLLAAVTFTPATDFNGSTSVSVAVDDGQSGPQGTNPTGTVSITVTEVNDAPIASNDSLTSIAEDSGVRTITFAALTGNDAPGPVTATDEAGQTLTVSAVSNATGGTVAIVSGHVEFTPTANFNGTAGFDYTVQDNGTTGGIADPKTATAHATFSITAVNDAPTATNLTQSLSLAEDVASPPKLFTAAPVVSDVDSASVTVTLTLANTAAGTLSTGTSGAVTSAYDSGTGVWTASGAKADINTLLAAVTFTPATDFNGSTSVSVAVDDGQSGPQGTNPSGTISITVTEVNDAPIASNDSLSSIAEDSGVRTITFAALTGNDAPGPVTATDEAGQTLTVSAVSNATGGTVAIVSGHVEFTPTTNFNGTAGFDYTVQDNGTTNGVADPKTATAHATFSVTAVNDAPAATNLTQSLSLAEDVASPPKLFTAAPVVSDIDSASVTVTLTLANTAAGTLSTGTSGAVTSTYDSGTGMWTASGAKADINTLLAAVTFTPATDFNGSTTVAVAVDDGQSGPQGTNPSGTISITVTEVNDAPIASADALSSIAEDSGVRTVTFAALTGNDAPGPVTATDEAGQTLTVSAVSNATGGTVAIVSGHIEFTPTTNFNGTAGFDYTVQDNGTTGGIADPKTATAHATFSVTEVNDTPVPVNDALSSVAEDSGQRTISFASLTGNDSAGPANESSQTLTITGVTSAVGGTVSISGSNVLFTPDADFNGTASFDYTVQDNGTTNGVSDAKSATGHASFTVTPVADTPSVTNASTVEDTQTASGLVISRNAADNTEVTNFKITGITNGTLFQHDGTTAIHNGDFITVAQGNAGLTFTPGANLNNPAGDAFSFDIQASTSSSDAGLGGSVITASIAVTEVNDAPVPTNDTLSSVQQDSGQRTISFASLFGNDNVGPANENGQLLTITNVGNAVGGTVSISGSNVLFTPTAGFNGTASFDYTVLDNGTTDGVADPQSAIGHASFTVNPLNIVGTSVNDSFTSGPGNDHIDGLAGLDTVVYSHAESAYTIARSGTTLTVSGPDGTDTLLNIEKLQFTDASLIVSPRTSDFDGSGTSDALLRNSDGSLWLNTYNGTTVTGGGPAGSPTIDWDVVATADFNGDGHADVALRNHASGQLWFNFYNGAAIVGSGPAGSPATDWDVAGTGDFNGDGKADMLLRNHASGQLWLNLYDGVTIAGSGPAGTPSTDWDVSGTGDFNGDGRSDVLLRNHDTGQLWMNFYNGTNIVGSGSAGGPTLDWDVAGIGDFNGDGMSDVLLHNHNTGQLWVNLYNGVNIAGSGPAGSPSTAYDVAHVADYNNDGHADVMLRNHVDGSLYMNLYNGLTIIGGGPAGSPTTDWHFV